MSQTSDRPPIPKSMRHKRVLDAAAENPEASLDEIASEIPSATAEYVEDVLDQYGDPADGLDEGSGSTDSSAVDDSADNGNQSEESATDLDGDAIVAERPDPDSPDTGGSDRSRAAELPDLEKLPEKQRTVLRAIAEHPEATQQELAELLDVSAPTISTRVNDIEGFEWNRRADLIATNGQTHASEPTQEATEMETPTPDQQPPVEQLSERLTALEDRVAALGNSTETQTVFEDPELAHKVMHACLESEAISEDEELELLRGILA